MCLPRNHNRYYRFAVAEDRVFAEVSSGVFSPFPSERMDAAMARRSTSGKKELPEKASNANHKGCTLRKPGALPAAILDGRRVAAADSGGERIDFKATRARQRFRTVDRRKRRNHQQIAGYASVKVCAFGFEIGPEAARNDGNQPVSGFTHGAGNRLLAGRNAARNRNTATPTEKERLIAASSHFGGGRGARNLI